jgi:hypothetical protein
MNRTNPHLSSRQDLAASYARKSTPDDSGLESQHRVNSEKARRDGYQIPDDPLFRYQDDDTSGRRTSRDQLDRLTHLVTQGSSPFSRVYIKDKTREGRFADPRFHFFLQVLFENHGVKICYSDREQQLDLSNGTPSQHFGLLAKDFFDGIAASEELLRLIKRVTEGKRIWVMKGFFPGSRPPYATERWYAKRVTGECLEPVNEHAVVRNADWRFKLRFVKDERVGIVRKIFDRIEAGGSLHSIAKELNRQGVLSPSGGSKWSPQAVRRIARNPVYRGAFVWGRTTGSGDPIPAESSEVDGTAPILVEGFIPDPPIPREQFERVQRILAGNVISHRQRRRSSPRFPLSGLVMCGVCGGVWHGHRSPPKRKTRRKYYRHGRVPAEFTGECPNRNRYLRADQLEPRVDGLVRELLQDKRLRDATEAALCEFVEQLQEADHHRRAKELQAEVERAQRTLDRLVTDRAGADSLEERDACQRAIDRMNARIETLGSQLEVHAGALVRAERLRRSVDRVGKKAERLTALYESATPSEHRTVYTELLRRIVVSKDLRTLTIEVSPLPGEQSPR